MQWLRFFRRRAWDDERARELASYLEHEIADNLARGMSLAQARHAAQRKLGSQTAVREEIYRMNSLGFFETLWQDVRYAFRGLRKSAGFTLVALACLALGIGATTAIFSVIYGVLISPYPYARPGEIWAPAILDAQHPRLPFSFVSVQDYVEEKKLPAFAGAMATQPETMLLTGDRTPEEFQAIGVTTGAFRFLGVPPLLGRTIQPSDIRPDGQPEPVLVLSYGGWQRLFDGRPGALGKKLVLDDQTFTVIGVMPPRFGWWTNRGGWIVLPEDPRDSRRAAAIFRLRPGVSPQSAEQQLQALHQRLAQEHPDNYPKTAFTTKLHNYLDITIASGPMTSSLTLLFGAVGFLLLIACANVANLQLARSTARSHEISVRMAVGAGRKRLLRQLLTESVVLASLGGVAGVLLALGITKAVVLLMPEFYVPNEARIAVNGYVLLFSVAVSVLTGILFGLAPALKTSRPDLVDALKDAGRTSGTASGGRTRNALVVAEIALSVVLLMGASLAIRGFVQLQSVNPGFQADRVLMMGLTLSPKRYTNYAQRVGFTEQAMAALANVPGVESVAVGNGSFPFGGIRSTYAIEGQPKEGARQLFLSLVSAGYMRTLGIPMRAGRGLTEQEVSRAEPVALINETAARLWRAGTDPIGAHVHIDLLEKLPPTVEKAAALTPDVTVVGIVGDTRNDGLSSPAAPAVYVPYTVVAPNDRLIALRTRSQPKLFVNAVRRRIQQIDPEQPLGEPFTLEESVGDETVQPRFNMALFSFFGFLGLALAAIGIYSMLSYTVARRTHEIGIRMALGAGRGDVLHLILKTAGRLVLAGLASGVAGSLALARLLRSEVFQVPATDPVALAGVAAILALAAFLACFMPSRRAAGLDPVSALRHE
ncbi:MAG TPA: ABC transporter permease [Bryobacteraceae bacterium]|nr:ABC transporter permease [Bryobacteraceae bacterium]